MKPFQLPRKNVLSCSIYSAVYRFIFVRHVMCARRVSDDVISVLYVRVNVFLKRKYCLFGRWVVEIFYQLESVSARKDYK